jgi:hypothetical protein
MASYHQSLVVEDIPFTSSFFAVENAGAGGVIPGLKQPDFATLNSENILPISRLTAKRLYQKKYSQKGNAPP